MVPLASENSSPPIPPPFCKLFDEFARLLCEHLECDPLRFDAEFRLPLGNARLEQCKACSWPGFSCHIRPQHTEVVVISQHLPKIIELVAKMLKLRRLQAAQQLYFVAESFHRLPPFMGGCVA